MPSERKVTTYIALNLTRTRITVLTFNLAIIAFMLSMIDIRVTATEYTVMAHLTSSIALYVGFCLTLLGLWWLLFSQNIDTEGLSRPWPFTLGSMTTYLALSQTITAFMHEYLVGIKLAVATSRSGVEEIDWSLVRLDALGEAGLSLLLVTGAIIWVVITYIAPLIAGLKAPVRDGLRWILAAYYFALQGPIYWVYARAFNLAYVPAEQPMNMLGLFMLQFIQPVLWFR